MTKSIETKLVFTNPINFLAFGFGAGLVSRAPGTVGTLVSVPLYYFLSKSDLGVYLSICGLVCIVGFFICGYAAKALKVHDHPGIVWDEFAGFLITMIAIEFSWINTLIGFILFRLFDIYKPWPISWLDKQVSGGFGIMLDDIVAGLFAMVSLHTIVYLLGYL